MGTRRPPAARLLAAVLAALALFLVSAGLSSAATSQQDLAQAKAKLAEAERGAFIEVHRGTWVGGHGG